MKVKYSEQLKSYLEKNVKPADEGFSLLWQIEGFLEGTEQEESNEKIKLDKQKSDAMELFDSCLESARSLSAKFGFGSVLADQGAVQICRLAIAMIEYIKNTNALDVLSNNLNSSKYTIPFTPTPAMPPYPLFTINKGEVVHVDKRDELFPDDLTDESEINLDQLYTRIFNLMYEETVMIRLHPDDRVFIYDEMHKLETLKQRNVTAIRYMATDNPEGYEIIDKDNRFYEDAKTGLLIG